MRDQVVKLLLEGPFPRSFPPEAWLWTRFGRLRVSTSETTLSERLADYLTSCEFDDLPAAPTSWRVSGLMKFHRRDGGGRPVFQAGLSWSRVRCAMGNPDERRE